MHNNDFELYSNQQEQQLEYVPNSQPFLPSTTYAMDPTFSAPYDHMAPLTEAPRPQDLQFHYDAIAQGVKAPSYQQQYMSPSGSPNSTSQSFHEQPPYLSASSESCASVSSSAVGSPSLNPQFTEPWNPMANGLGLTSGFEYPGMVETVKVPGCVGESKTLPSRDESFPSVASPTTPKSEATHTNVFKSPSTPASAKWSAQWSSAHATRRNSLLSNEVRAYDISESASQSSSSSVNPSPLAPRLSNKSSLSSSCPSPPNRSRLEGT
jgi:hypothetical protein